MRNAIQLVERAVRVLKGAGDDRGADYPGVAAPGGRGGAVPRGEGWREGACYSLTPW